MHISVITCVNQVTSLVTQATQKKNPTNKTKQKKMTSSFHNVSVGAIERSIDDNQQQEVGNFHFFFFFFLHARSINKTKLDPWTRREEKKCSRSNNRLKSPLIWPQRGALSQIQQEYMNINPTLSLEPSSSRLVID